MLPGKMQAVSRAVFNEIDEVKTTFVATSGRPFTVVRGKASLILF